MIKKTNTPPYYEANEGSVKVYKALLSQTGTSAPVARVYQNNLGGEVVWTRDGTGIYVGTLAGKFDDDQVFTICQILGHTTAIMFVQPSPYGPDAIGVFTYGFDGELKDILGNGVYIEVQVNPNL